MKKPMIASLAVATIALLAAANVSLAKDGPYVSGAAGVAFNKEKFEVKSQNTTGQLDTDTGYNLNAAVGYKVDDFRIEGAIGYIKNDYDTFVINGSRIPAADGNISTTTLMANGYYDFKMDSPLTPYVGLGIGAARIDLDGDFDKETAFAYQGIIGASYQLSDDLSLNADYRYLATADKTFRSRQGTELELRERNHLINVGLTYNF